ncbi:MAG: YciI family protein [Nitrosomonas sp.]|nr:MAG: YciI family protein [Nitrosomonas sp.]
MLYVINGEDIPDSLEKRMTVRSEHLKRIQALQEEGRLILAGPYPTIDSQDPGTAGFSGSLIIAEFDSLQAAQSWADADPYVISGVYHKVTVKPFKKVLPV